MESVQKNIGKTWDYLFDENNKDEKHTPSSDECSSEASSNSDNDEDKLKIKMKVRNLTKDNVFRGKKLVLIKAFLMIII